MPDLPQKLEAILFVSTQEEPIEKLARVLNVSEIEIDQAIKTLQTDSINRGITIIENNRHLQMVSSPQYALEIAQFHQKDLREKLSDLALETLAIIAYQGPISRYQIEDIRGVNSTFVLRNLLRRGLIERKVDGKKSAYQTSTDFLNYLGLKNINALPKYQEFQSSITQKTNLNNP